MTALNSIHPLKTMGTWLLLGVVCAGAGTAVWKFSSSEQSSLSSQELNAQSEEWRKSFAGKELPDIKTMLNEQINEIEEFQSDTAMRFSAVPPDSEFNENIPLISPPTASKIQSAFTSYLDALVFNQVIYGDSSRIGTTFREDKIIAETPGYELYNYGNVQLKTEAVHFRDGTSQKASELEEGTVSQAWATKRIVSVDMSATFTVPGTVTELKYTANNRSRQKDIALESIVGGNVILTMPPSSHEKILYVQGIDANGKALKQYGQSANTNNGQYLEKLKKFSIDTVKRINQGEFNDKEQLIEYFSRHQPLQAEFEKKHPPQTISTYQFGGEPVSIIVFLKPEELVQTYHFTINKTQDNYENGLTVSRQADSELYGIIDEQGQWIIQPNYHNLFHKVDYYYSAEDTNGADHVYLLDRQSKKLVVQPFYITDEKIYQERFVVINKDSGDNRVKGLVDIHSHELVLPMQYDAIEFDGKFISTRYRKSRSRVFNGEVYLQSNKKLVLSGEFYDLTIDGDLIIANRLIISPKKLSDRIAQSGDGHGNSIYYNIDIYNAEGQRLNQESFMNIDDRFGKDGLLRVTDIRDASYYIDRQGKQAQFELFYKNIEPFSNGLAAVQGIDDKYGYINTKGDMVIDPTYDSALPFVGGTALVTELGVGSFLITPNNETLAKFTDAYESSNTPKDGQDASYTFVSYSENGENSFASYNERGKLIPQKN